MRPPKVTFIERSQSPEKEDPIMIQAPQVNLNGTSKESLMEQVRNAADACYNLQAQLADMRPHGRDYQTAPEGAYQRARSEHDAREAKVQSVLDDLHAIYQQLMMQGKQS